MSHWKDRLLEADRALTSELSAEEAQRLRRSVVAEAASAALVLSTVTALPGAAAPPPGDLAVAGEIAPGAPEAGGGRQQLQFATPGGTRIIWVFDAEFEVKGTLP